MKSVPLTGSVYTGAVANVCCDNSGESELGVVIIRRCKRMWRARFDCVRNAHSGSVLWCWHSTVNSTAKFVSNLTFSNKREVMIVFFFVP